MPAQKYTIENGDVHQIEISWSGIWKNARVTCDGRELGTFTDQKDLRVGKVFEFPDGRNLSVQLVERFTAVELHVLCDGEPIRGSASDPNQRLKVAYQIVFFVAALSGISGILAGLFQVAFLVNIGFNYESIIDGGVFFVLGWFVKRRSIVALGLAVSLFTLSGIMLAVNVAAQGHGPQIGALIGCVFLLIPMIQGFGAIRALKAECRGDHRDGQRPEPSAQPASGPRRPLQAKALPGNPTIPGGRWIVAAILVAVVIYLAIVILQPAGSASR